LLATVVFVVLWQAALRRAEPSQEAAAIRALTVIAEAQSAYAAAAGHRAYARSLAKLGKCCPAALSGFLPPDLASDPVVKSGYEFTLHLKPEARKVSLDCHGEATYSGYYVTARPLSAASGTRRAFTIDETGVVWFDESGVPPRPPFDTYRAVR
jgi:hypothetical protein